MKNTNKSERYLINASYGACAEAEQVFRNGGDSILHGADVFIVETGSKGGKDVLPSTDLYAAAGAGNRRIDKDNGVKLRIHNGTQVNFRTMMSRLKVFLIDKYRKASYVKR